ncbi:MAG: prolipoprotein diacylglyceryl transferase [Lachnospiraceae bacterium]|jgi:phosphatidylglycerol:prolipoprotein diacylglycerol transferase|nr:prolipoprotein diacylglyceryl transferase [Lachnospiraceae bacterium]MCI1727414.1 prolipoprotein diacylglyceryl transferase [Lachnospiraceae bacterium]
MCPTIHFFNLTLPTYSLIGISGILLGWLFSVYHGIHLNKDRDDCTFLYMYGFIGGLIGAKLLPVLLRLPAIVTHIGLLFSDPSDFAAQYLGGLVFYGGLIGGMIGALIYCRQYRLYLPDYFTAVIPAIPLVHAIGRLGCFCAGCCYGKPTGLWFGVTFPAVSEAPGGIPRIPTQLIESACLFLLFFILWRYSFVCRREMNMLPAYLISYGILRFLIEFLRGDDIRGFLGPLSTSQWISIAAVLTGLFLLFKKDRREPVSI